MLQELITSACIYEFMDIMTALVCRICGENIILSKLWNKSSEELLIFSLAQ